MTNARPFRTSTLQDLSNDTKNAQIQGDLTPTIELWIFGSPEGLQLPTFGSVGFTLTLSPKWGCDTLPHQHNIWACFQPSSKLPKNNLSSMLLCILVKINLFLFLFLFLCFYIFVSMSIYTFHGHEKTHVNLFFYIHVGG